MAISLLVLLELKEETATLGTYCSVWGEWVGAHGCLPGLWLGLEASTWQGKLQTAGSLEQECC